MKNKEINKPEKKKTQDVDNSVWIRESVRTASLNRLSDRWETYHLAKMKQVLEELKLPKCGKTYDCDSCPYNNDNECNLHQFNQRIDNKLNQIERGE